MIIRVLCLNSSPTSKVYPSRWEILLKSSPRHDEKRKKYLFIYYHFRNRKSSNQKDEGKLYIYFIYMFIKNTLKNILEIKREESSASTLEQKNITNKNLS